MRNHSLIKCFRNYPNCLAEKCYCELECKTQSEKELGTLVDVFYRIKRVAQTQKAFLVEMQDRLGIRKPIFVNRNLIEWKAVEKQTGIGIWEVAEDKLVKAEDVRSDHIIGRYKLTDRNSDVWEIWFDIESNKSFTTASEVQNHFRKLHEATKKVLDVLLWLGIPQECIFLKSSGRGFHVHVFLQGVRGEEQYRKIVEAILTETGLPNIKSREYTQLDDVVFGIDKAPSLQTVRKIREYGGVNDKLSGTFHYCSNITLNEFTKLKGYPFVFDSKHVRYPDIKIFKVDAKFIHKVHEVVADQITQELREITGTVSYELEGDPKELYQCPLIAALVKKAKEQKHLTNVERVFLCQLFPFFGEKGEKELHEIISYCQDYDEQYTQMQIDNMKRNNRKPITCAWAQKNVGCPSNCKGSGGKSPIKFAWKSVDLHTVKDRFRKWLSFQTEDGTEDLEPLEVVLAAACDRELSGDPVWLLLVAPSGGTKTEILRSLKFWKAYTLDSLTTKTLVSGLTYTDKKSKKRKAVEGILGDLDGKILVIKDFTLILTKPTDERNEIFGQLRNAYDGYLEYGFGTLPEPIRIKSSFGLIAGVTPIIDNYHQFNVLLGERYLKARLKLDRRIASQKAMQNVGKEKEMREELQRTVYNFLKGLEFHDLEINEKSLNFLINLAMFTAKIRTPVWASNLGAGITEYMATTEVATRLVKQLAKLLKLVVIVRGKSQIDDDDITSIVRVAFDTVPQDRMEIIKFLYANGASGLREISRHIKMSTTGTKRKLEEMLALEDVVEYENSDYGSTDGNWRLHDSTIKFLDEVLSKKGKVYADFILNKKINKKEAPSSRFSVTPDGQLDLFGKGD